MSIRTAAATAVRSLLIRDHVLAARLELRARITSPSTRRRFPPQCIRQAYSTQPASNLQDTQALGDSIPQVANTLLEPTSQDVTTEAVSSEVEEVESKIDNTSKSDLPWYLQVGASETPSASPFAARQKLPDLPETPPPILSTLLSHVSVELGMDDLSLLDLRGLDPPAALGANLLMIIGTARSEKHLHVAADRLCRWLRTEHQLSPFADGLLGRKELKLRMKRKAKRAKLVSSVGAKTTGGGNVDDGIRTGWVCVNVGQVEGGILAGHKESEEGFVGFRTQETGCNIVVQMMTDEKRGTLDLESLWVGIMNRSGLGSADEVKAVAKKAVASDRPADFSNPFPEARLVVSA